MPRVHVEWVFVTLQMYRLINLIGPTWHPYFSKHTGMTECVRAFHKLHSKFSKQKTFNQYYSEERDEWNNNSHPIKTLELLDQKVEGYQARP